MTANKKLGKYWNRFIGTTLFRKNVVLMYVMKDVVVLFWGKAHIVNVIIHTNEIGNYVGLGGVKSSRLDTLFISIKIQNTGRN